MKNPKNTYRFASGLLFCALLRAAVGSPSEKPNLIVILADDMGYGDSSAYGGWIRTPQLERLAAEGLRFTDFHSSGSVCSPTRAGLLTGRYQQRAGISGVVLASEKNPSHFGGLQQSETTLPELLKASGYATALVGKWHLGYYPCYNPVRHGFDEFRGYLSGNVDYRAHRDNQGRADWWNGESLAPEEGYSTHLITQHASEFIRRNRDRPFFLLVAHEAVHDPYQGPDDPPIRSGEGRGQAPARRPVREAYREMMTEMDKGIGAVIDTLRETGLAEKTLVIFFSDNGATEQGSNGRWRGYKGSDWEGGHRVPSIVWWPGRVSPGVTGQTAISIDVMPTLLDFAGVDAPERRRLDGVSLRRLLLERSSLAPRRLFWNGDAMREGPWKLMLSGGSPRLFNLDDDPGETRDIAAGNGERVEAMRAALDRWREDVSAGATVQPKNLEELR